MENNVLVIDDKAGNVKELKDSGNVEENLEGENLQYLIQGIKNNSLNPIFLNDVNDTAESQIFINKQTNIKGVVLDLNLNSTDGIEPQDIEQLKFLLSTLQKKFGKFFIFVFSSLADQWEYVQNELEEDNPELKSLFRPSNIKVLQKGTNKEAVIYEEIQSFSNTILNDENKEVLLQAKIIMCKNWITEWLFLGIILSLLNVFCLLYKIFPSFFHHLTIEIGVFLITFKAINLEHQRIQTLNKYLNNGKI